MRVLEFEVLGVASILGFRLVMDLVLGAQDLVISDLVVGFSALTGAQLLGEG